MLEKVVLITSAYFCMSMEIKFQLKEATNLGFPEDQLSFGSKDCETFHAKALHLALVFLPDDSPLADYFYQTYVESYLKKKKQLKIILKPTQEIKTTLALQTLQRKSLKIDTTILPQGGIKQAPVKSSFHAKVILGSPTDKNKPEKKHNLVKVLSASHFS